MDLTPPAEVAAVAAKALEMRAEQSPSNRGGTPVGVKRANQLANRENLSPSTIRRMVSFFARHEVDKQATGFRKGEEGFPSKGRQAWDLWGGDPGKSWAEKMQRKLDAEASPKQEETTMIDVNVLTGADVRRIDGKYGKVSKVSMPWVTVKWDNGMEESYLRSDESLAEDIELKTLDKGWLSLGSVVGTAEVAEQAAQKPAEEAATQSTKDLIAEARRLAFCLSSAYRRIEEARQSTKEKAKAKKAAKKGGGKKEKEPAKAKTGGANNSNPTNPFHNYKTIGKFSPKKKKRTEKKIWKCSKSGDGQMCVAQKDVPSQGVKKGQEKFITRWAGKEAYDTDYDMGRAAGDYKLPNGAVAPVAHKYY